MQALYSAALAAQQTMQHVRNNAQASHSSIHIPCAKHAVAKWLASTFLLLNTPLWHDAEGASLNIVSVPRVSVPTPSEVLKILAVCSGSIAGVPPCLTRSNHIDAHISTSTRDVQHHLH